MLTGILAMQPIETLESLFAILSPLTGILAMQPIETEVSSPQDNRPQVDRYSGDAANWNFAPDGWKTTIVDRYSGDAANWNIGQFVKK